MKSVTVINKESAMLNKKSMQKHQLFMNVVLFCLLIMVCGCQKKIVDLEGDISPVIVGIPVQISDDYSYQPDWSPDGLKIVCENPFKGKLLIMEKDGTDIREVTASNYSCPSWLPDGSTIGFLIRNDEFKGELATIIKNGEGLTRITTNANVTAGWDWSPIKESIVFASTDGLTIMHLANKVKHILVPGQFYCDWPQYSFDGKKIVFESTQQDSICQIWSIMEDGTNLKKITQNGGEYPSWSPDGKWIVFIKDWDVTIIPSEGGATRKITNTPDIKESRPRWSPDGAIIVYDRSFSDIGSRGIWTVDITIKEEE